MHGVVHPARRRTTYRHASAFAPPLPSFHDEVTRGFHISRPDPVVLCPFVRIDLRLRTPEEVLVSLIHLISSGLVALIFIYLIAALLYPEKF